MAATLQTATRSAIRQLKAYSPSANLDAELLLVHVLQRDRTWIFAHPERILAPVQDHEYAALIARRVRGEPLAYLTGRREFFRHTFDVNRHTLIPRPETELIVERVLDLTEPEQPFQLLDLGTGSGAIALSIALARPNATVAATDISAAALDVARNNAQALRARNVEFRCGNWYAPLPGQRYDIVVSNPPYVESGSPSLERSEQSYEPRRALVAGRDGLDGIQAVAAGAVEALYPGGTLLIEHGATQGYATRVILSAHGLDVQRCHTDLAGLDRVTEASN